jgi:plastocyanin
MKKGFALLAAAGLMGLAACGDDDKDKGGSAKAQTLSVSVDGQGKLQGVQPLKGGLVTVNFRNGSKNPTDLQLIRVDGNRPIAQVLKVVNSEGPTPIPTWLHGAGGVGGTKPGQTATATQVLPSGNYYVVASPESDGPSKPATAALKVEGGESSAELPSTPATVTATEYKFQATGLKAGKNQVRFANDGKELHHVIAFQLMPGKTAADLKRFFTTEKGQPPIVEGSETGTAVIDGGTEQVTDLTLAKPGNWALVCFISDRKGGPPHAAKGMITPVTVQ